MAKTSLKLKQIASTTTNGKYKPLPHYNPKTIPVQSSNLIREGLSQLSMAKSIIGNSKRQSPQRRIQHKDFNMKKFPFLATDFEHPFIC